MTAADTSAFAGAWNGLEAVPDMDSVQFEQWAELLTERTGMRMPIERKSFLVTSLNLRMREIGFRDYQQYYEFLKSGKAGDIEWTALVDRLTVHETRFFRDARALRFLQTQILPKMEIQDKTSIQIWSAGCSTGEEPYSIAMVVDEYLADLGRGYYGITATDISLLSLSVGKRAIYSDRKVRNMAEDYLERYFLRVDEDLLQISDDLRARICFAQMNILDAPKAPIGKMDIIYCQNLLIYFDREKRADILDGMVSHLRPGGTLILGAGEVIGWQNDAMKRIEATHVLAFQKRES